MPDELKDILSQPEKAPTQEEMLKYLKKEMGKEALHHFEKSMLQDYFNSEAIEGLQQVENKEKISLIVAGLNRDLKKRTAKNKKAMASRALKPQWLLYFSIIILLIIVALIYLYLHRFTNS